MSACDEFNIDVFLGDSRDTHFLPRAESPLFAGSHIRFLY